jgi:hypothetical protein
MKFSTILLSFHSNTCTNVLRLNMNTRYALSWVPICVACRRTTYFSRSREYSFEKNGISVTNPTTAAAAASRAALLAAARSGPTPTESSPACPPANNSDGGSALTVVAALWDQTKLQQQQRAQAAATADPPPTPAAATLFRTLVSLPQPIPTDEEGGCHNVRGRGCDAAAAAGG